MIIAVTNTGNNAPTITGFNPSSIPGSGQLATNVTINGTNFVSGGTTVTVGGSSRTITTFVSTTEIVVSFPPLAPSTTTVVVTTAGGSASANYTYTIPAPIIDAIDPESGTSGTRITLYGLNMSGGTVSIGGTTVSASFGNNTASFTCPTLGADGNRTISVTTGGGTATATFYYIMQRAAETTSYTSGSGTYTVPWWANSVDVVCLGAGASGDGGSLVNRRGGAAGAWAVGTLTAVASSALSYSVGVGGSSTSRFDRNIAGTASSGNAVSGAGGSGANGTSALGAAPSPTSFTYNGITFTPAGTNGYGGDGATVSNNPGAPGQSGQVWFVARQ